MLRTLGVHLGSLAGKDLAARCAEGRLDARGRAQSRAVRKRALTAESSSRWAGAITRTSEDQVRLAEQNLRAEGTSLQARIRRIEARLAIQAGSKSGTMRGYATAAERHAKAVRLQSLQARRARVERQLKAGAVSVVRGGKTLLRGRGSLARGGLTEAQWRERWESARMFLTADGEKDKAWGNETIRWHPDAGWLEIKLPAPLAHLANQPTAATGYRLRLRSGTAEMRSPPRQPAAPSVTTSTVTWYEAAGTSMPRGRLPQPARRPWTIYGQARWWPSTSTTAISLPLSSHQTATSSAPQPLSVWIWLGCRRPPATGTCEPLSAL